MKILDLSIIAAIMVAPPTCIQQVEGANSNHIVTMIEADETVSCVRKEIKLSEKDIERFWKKVQKGEPDECWLWTACTNRGGYGLFRTGPRIAAITWLTNRFVWTITQGAIPRKKSSHDTCICHRCDTPACCNPKHLFLASQKENSEDMDAKGRRRGGKGVRQWKAKLNPELVREIRRVARTCEFTYDQMAVQFNVNRNTIYRIVNRHFWAHVED